MWRYFSGSFQRKRENKEGGNFTGRYILNRVKGRLIEIEESSSTVCCTVITGKNSLKVKLPQEIFISMNLNAGDEVWLILALRKLKIITDGE